MATERQIATNRLNAQKSTGPRTERGKRRTRRNAFRHGLTAESVITVLEDEADYKKFENTLLRDYAPESTIERALVARLASLLWRLRRAVAIESGLFQIQGQILRDRHLIDGHDDPNDPLKVFYELRRHPFRDPVSHGGAINETELLQPGSMRKNGLAEMAITFLRLENFNQGKLDLIGRYETRLWRQLWQTISLIHSLTRSGPTYERQKRRVLWPLKL